MSQNEQPGSTRSAAQGQPTASAGAGQQLRTYWSLLLRLLSRGGFAASAHSAPEADTWPDSFATRETVWDGQAMTAVQLPDDQWLLVCPSFWQQVVATARTLREGLGHSVVVPGASPTPERLRRQLLAHLLREGTVTDPNIARAMLTVPRHLFLPREPLERAYADDAVITKQAGNINLSSASQPAMVAIMLEQLMLQPGLRVLEIGAGTGYNAALMAELVGAQGHVTTVDIDQDIVDTAHEQLATAGYTAVETVCSDGAAGYATNAPYDRIILTVGASDIAPAWRDQLAEGGVLVVPLRLHGMEQSIAFRREGDVLRSVSARPCGFIRLRGLLAAPELRVAAPDANLVCVAEDGHGIDADALRALLDQPPRAEPFPFPFDTHVWWRWSLFTLWSALRGDRAIELFDRVGRLDGEAEKHWPGFYDPTDNSLVLIDSAAARLLLLGGTGAAQRLRRSLSAFEAVDFWQNRRFALEIFPAGTVATAPTGAWLLRFTYSDIVLRVI